MSRAPCLRRVQQNPTQTLQQLTATPRECGWSVRLSANHCCRVSGGTARKPSSGAAPVLATVLIFLAIRGALSLRAGAAQSHDHRVGAPDREGGAVRDNGPLQT